MNTPPKETKVKKTEEGKAAGKPAESKTAKIQIETQPRGQIFDDILKTIGATPLVRLPNIKAENGLEADILAKLESFNPLGSSKDRVALAMIEDAEAAGKITPGKSVLIEPTAGNTGVSLAFIAASKRYRLILTMPESVPFERRKLLGFYGAEIFLTPADRGMKGAIEKADELMKEHNEDGYMFKQFENPAGKMVHAQTTAKEIWEDTGGKIDILVAGVGTGATITGIAHVLSQQNKDLKVYAVEPEESAVLSGEAPTQHRIEGIGAGFVPPELDMKLLTGIIKIDSDRALETARKAAQLEGIPCGISSGAALAAAIDLAGEAENKGKMIVVIFPSGAERYISTELFEGAGK